MLAMLTAFCGASLVAPLAVRRFGARAFLGLALVPAVAFVVTARMAAQVRNGRAVEESVSWIAELDVSIAVRVDALSWVLALIVTGVGTLVLVYCARYFRDDEPGLAGFAGVFVAFAAAMYGLVISDDVIAMFVFWEATTVTSYLLIGHTATRLASRQAALQALVVTTAGGLAMFVGLVMLAAQSGSTRLSVIVADPPSGTSTTVAIMLILVGALSKSALFPFHFWLPSAMAAPTPVSAYLHAAAMVKAGVYLIARLAPGFADVPGWKPAILILGTATLVIGGYRALRQHDLKLLLAFGTVSQLGLLTIAVGYGTPAAAQAGIALVIAHALFKSSLFLTVGAIDRLCRTRDLRELSGLGKRLPVLAGAAIVAAASMAALPPLLGFVAKEALFTALWDDGTAGALVALGVVVVGSMLTVAYAARFVWGAFAAKADVPPTTAGRLGFTFGVPIVLLSVSGVVLGVGAGLVDAAVAPWVETFAGIKAPALSLWHGLTIPLLLSAVAIAAGAVLAANRVRVNDLQGRARTGPSADAVYRYVLNRVDALAVWVTGRTQVGSLPIYLAVTLTTLVVLVGTALVVNSSWPSRWRLWDYPAQAIVLVVITIAAFAATRATKRFAAVVIVGITGYSVALIFALQGAPDLALTQFLVETITLAAFVLVLRRLPVRIGEKHGSSRQRARALLSAAVAIVVMVATAVAAGARSFEPISIDWGRLAYSFGGGKNIVNVALVDIRAWDTFGEISVLVVAATGVASLIFIVQRSGQIPRVDPVKHLATQRQSWLLAGRTLAPETRSIILEVAVRLMFHSAIVLSLFLLFSGHNRPGGGFAGGLVVGLALTARYLAGGRYELGEAAPIDVGPLLGTGLLLAASTALAGFFLGGDVLQSAIFTWHLPVFGDVKLVTSLFFDIGVYLVVVGLMLDVLRSLGAGVDRQGAMAR